MWEAYFVGVLKQTYRSGLTNRAKPFSPDEKAKILEAYFKSAELGSVDGALKYLHTTYFVGPNFRACNGLNSMINMAVRTYKSVALLLKAAQLNEGLCIEKNYLLSLLYWKWSGDFAPYHGAKFFDIYQKMNAAERQKLDAIDFRKPPKINGDEFLKHFFRYLEKHQEKRRAK
jgi:hypothetical protein